MSRARIEPVSRTEAMQVTEVTIRENRQNRYFRRSEVYGYTKDYNLAHALYSGFPVLRDIGFADHRFLPLTYFLSTFSYRLRQYGPVSVRSPIRNAPALPSALTGGLVAA